jgi:HK97 family phage major capsid protein
MYKATRSFAAEYDGEVIEITAGKDMVSNDHELRRRYPDAFEFDPSSAWRERSQIRAQDQEGRSHALYTSADLERERQAERERVAELAKDPANREEAFAPPATRNLDHALATRDGAMRTLQRHVDADRLSSEAAGRVDQVLRGPDAGLGLDAAYIEAAGSEAYERAFAKLIRYGDGAVLRMTAEEQAAVQKTNRADEIRTALTSGSGAGGGFAIPIAIDPTVNLSSNGAINPIRELAEVRPMSTRELRLVTSDGVVAQYQAEAAEAIDNSPVLAQPTLVAQRATSFVPFSFELGDDWGSIASELATLISDAKDVLEATKFLSGSGTNEPVGILTVGTTGALTTAQRVQSATAGTVAIADIYSLKQAPGSTRFAAEAVWTMHPNRLDAVFRFTPSGSTTEPQIMTDRDGPLLGRPTAEWSTMTTAVTTGSKVAIYADWKQAYVIGDRLGMQLEIIPHLFGGTNRYPTGQRGAYAIWRNDGRVKVLNAARYLETS